MRLGDHVLKIGSGITPRGGRDVYLSDGPIALVRSQNVQLGHFTRSGLAYLDDALAAGLDGVKVEPGDVLLNITGDSVARVCLAPADLGDARVNQHVAIIRTDANILDQRFLHYWMVSPAVQARLHALASAGATRPALTKTMIENLDPPAFHIAEQRTIAGVLGALDEKIEANRRMNATLEALARTLFKSWFVDFDPVQAKMESRTPALAPDLAALFPARLSDSPLGPIPEGWEVKALRDIVADGCGEIRTGPFGSQLHQSDYTVEGTPVVMPANLIDGTVDESEIARVGEADVERLSDHQLRVGDIVYGRRGDIGRKALVGQTEVGWLCGTGCLRIRCDVARCPPLYLFQFLGLDTVREWIATRAVGATMPNLNTGILGEVAVLLPSEPVAQAFVAAAEPLDNAMRVRRQQSQTLAQLRDLVLPKLLSGALHVRDVERMIGDAA